MQVVAAQQVLVELLGLVAAAALRIGAAAVLPELFVLVTKVTRLAGQRFEVQRVVDPALVAAAHATGPARRFASTMQ